MHALVANPTRLSHIDPEACVVSLVWPNGVGSSSQSSTPSKATAFTANGAPADPPLPAAPPLDTTSGLSPVPPHPPEPSMVTLPPLDASASVAALSLSSRQPDGKAIASESPVSEPTNQR